MSTCDLKSPPAQASAQTISQVVRSKRRAWPRVRFGMRTLLLLPLIVTVLLLVLFPKLMTGDFVQATVVSVENTGNGFAITLDAHVSSSTGYGETLSFGPFNSLGTSGHTLRHWTSIIPTWPRHELIVVNLGLREDALPPGVDDPAELIKITPGSTYRVTPGQPLTIAAATTNGHRGGCSLRVTPGNRLGL